MNINRELRLKIDKHFTLDELRIICFDLSIDFDHILGQDKLSKIVGLIEYVNRKDRLDGLLNVLQLERPDVDWSCFSKKNSRVEVDLGNVSDDPVRTAVWNALHQSLWTKRTFLNPHKKQDPLIDKFSANLWADYFNKPIDARPKDPQLILEEVRDYFFKCSNKDFYNYLNFILDFWNYLRHYKPDLINAAVNRALKQQGAGLQYVPQYEYGTRGLFANGIFEQIHNDTN